MILPKPGDLIWSPDASAKDRGYLLIMGFSHIDMWQDKIMWNFRAFHLRERVMWEVSFSSELTHSWMILPAQMDL